MIENQQIANYFDGKPFIVFADGKNIELENPGGSFMFYYGIWEDWYYFKAFPNGNHPSGELPWVKDFLKMMIRTHEDIKIFFRSKGA